MIIGQMLFTASLIACLWGCTQGIGVKDADLAISAFIKARHAIITLECFYLASHCFVKSSICFALLRIATDKKIRYIIYGTMVSSWITGFTPCVIILSLCRPSSAAWTGNGKCTAYFITVTAIITDLLCSILPFVILWNLHMDKKRKFTIAAILGLGVIASLATIVRACYFDRFASEVNYTWGYADLIIWSYVEGFITVTIGSVHSLKPLFVKYKMWSSTRSSSKQRSTQDNTVERHTSYALSSHVKPVMTSRVTPHGLQSDSATDNLAEDNILVESELHVYTNDERPGVFVSMNHGTIEKKCTPLHICKMLDPQLSTQSFTPGCRVPDGGRGI